MRTIELMPADFVHFKMLANDIRLWFLYNISGGIVFVEADSIILESLGYQFVCNWALAIGPFYFSYEYIQKNKESEDFDECEDHLWYK